MNSRRKILKKNNPISPWTRRDGDWLINEHRRRVPAGVSSALLPALLDPAEKIWPADVWPQLILDNGMNVGSAGGHGPIRYHVIESEPQRVRFAFDELDGWHEFRLEDDVVVHELRIRRPPVPLRFLVIPQHDALIEHLLDDIESGHGQYPARRWPRGSRWRYGLTAIGGAVSTQQPVVRGLVAGAVGSIGALHLAWAAGSPFPARSRVGLANAVIGASGTTTKLPSVIPTVGVGAGLVGLAGIVAAQSNSPALHAVGGPSQRHLDTALRAAEVGFGARGVIGLLAPTGARHPRYRVLNLVAYSPLCLLLAGGIHALLAGGETRADEPH